MTTPTTRTTRFVPISFAVSSWNSLCSGYHVCKAVTAMIATTEPKKPLHESLGDVGNANEPVGRSHQLHHRYLAPPGEDGHANRVQDQYRRREQQYGG